MPDFFNVGKTDPIVIGATPTNQKRISNSAGGKLFYKTAADVDTEDTELAVGSAVTVDATNWIISESESKVVIEEVSAPTVQDLSVTDDLTVTDKATVKGELEVDGDLNHDGEKIGFFGVAPAARPEVKKAELTANELATELAKMGIVKVEA